jgi:hypothetical protein
VTGSSAQNKLQRGQLRLAGGHQGQHHNFTPLLFSPRDEIVDRFQVEFLIQGKQIHVQHQQVPPHVHHLLKSLMAAQSPPTRRHGSVKLSTRQRKSRGRNRT